MPERPAQSDGRELELLQRCVELLEELDKVTDELAEGFDAAGRTGIYLGGRFANLVRYLDEGRRVATHNA